MGMERLDRILASTGRFSRREARGLIRAGRVEAAGRVCRAPEEKHDPDAEAICVDGARLDCARYVYVMLHKPAGLVSATEDPRQPTVLSLLPEHLQRRGLFPVGRLDKDTEGLLLLTDDGALAHALLAPRRHVDKTYFALTDGVPDAADAAALAAGMTLGDGLRCLPAALESLPQTVPGEGRSLVTLREGKYHQVRRMLAARGKPVRYLRRLTMGPLTLDEGLAPGEWRHLRPEEEQALEAIRHISQNSGK